MAEQLIFFNHIQVSRTCQNLICGRNQCFGCSVPFAHVPLYMPKTYLLFSVFLSKWGNHVKGACNLRFNQNSKEANDLCSVTATSVPNQISRLPS
jgi:hypothetical protein